MEELELHAARLEHQIERGDHRLAGSGRELPDGRAQVGERAQGPVQIAAGGHHRRQRRVAVRVLVGQVDGGHRQRRADGLRLGAMARQPVAPVLVVDAVVAARGDVVGDEASDQGQDVVDDDESAPQGVVVLDQLEDQVGESGPFGLQDRQQGMARVHARAPPTSGGARPWRSDPWPGPPAPSAAALGWCPWIRSSRNSQTAANWSSVAMSAAHVGRGALLVGKVCGQRCRARSRNSHISTKFSGRKASSKVASGCARLAAEFGVDLRHQRQGVVVAAQEAVDAVLLDPAVHAARGRAFAAQPPSELMHRDVEPVLPAGLAGEFEGGDQAGDAAAQDRDLLGSSRVVHEFPRSWFGRSGLCRREFQRGAAFRRRPVDPDRPAFKAST